MDEYIKREDVYDAIKYNQCELCDNIISCYACSVGDALNNIQSIHAADVVKVRHGEWVQTTEPLGWSDVNCIECSACGESWIMGEELCFDDYKDGWKYCPNCGAKMDGNGEGE